MDLLRTPSEYVNDYMEAFNDTCYGDGLTYLKDGINNCIELNKLPQFMHIDYALEVLKIVNYLKLCSPRLRKKLTAVGKPYYLKTPVIKVRGGKPTRNY